MSETSPTTRLSAAHLSLTAVVSSLLSSLGYAAFLLSGNFRATFGPIDDHEALAWLGGESKLPLNQVAYILLNRTEVGDFGETPRFRPAYYFVRVGQATLLGDNPPLWYGFSLLVFAATIALLGFTTWVWFSLGIGEVRSALQLVFAVVIPGVGVILFGSLRAWTGVVARLGPSELLAMFGVALAMVGSTLLVVRPSLSWWLPALVGTFLAVGSKENFLPVALVPVTVGVFRFARSRSFVHVCSVVATLMIVITVFLGVSATAGLNGTDVYGRSTGVDRAIRALSELVGTYAVFWLPGVLLLLVSLGLWLLTRPRPNREIRILMLVIVASVFLWLFFDVWTYRGVYEMVRYWMVFDFLKLLAIIGAAVFSSNVLLHRDGLGGRGLALIALVASICLAALQVVAAPQKASALREEVRANALASLEWADGVTTVIDEAQTLNRPQIVILPRGSIDFEPAIALAGALSAEGGDAPVFVKVEGVGSATPDGAPQVEVLQREGWENPLIQPLSILDESGDILCVFLNAEPKESTECSPDRSVSVSARST